MPQEVWTAVDDYINDLLVPEDEALIAAVKASDAASLPSINVSPSQGKLLHLVAKGQGARTILEIGTLGGYSTIWLARALPRDGHLISLEADPKHIEVARSNIAHAGLSDIVELRLGRAQDTLPQLVAEKRPPFDFVFIDADKPGYADYFRWSLKLTRPGSIIVADNVVYDGDVANPAAADPRVQGIRRFNEAVAAEPRVSATAIQTVGSKGYDGFALMVVNAEQ